MWLLSSLMILATKWKPPIPLQTLISLAYKQKVLSIVWSEYHVPDVCYYLHDVFQLTNGEFKAICNKQTSVCVQWFDLQQKIEWVWQSRPYFFTQVIVHNIEIIVISRYMRLSCNSLSVGMDFLHSFISGLPQPAC